MADNGLPPRKTTRLRSGRTIGGPVAGDDEDSDRQLAAAIAASVADASGHHQYSATDKSIVNNSKDTASASAGDNGVKNNGNGKEMVNGYHSVDTDSDNSVNQYISSLVLWRRPLDTIYYATLELIHQVISLTKWVLCHTRTCLSLVLLFAALTAVSWVDGPHQPVIQAIRKQALWCLYWCGLGVLSSVGLGTGLHTFLLYLGPHIASVTLAAYECDSLDFPSPPYPDEIICPVPVPGVQPLASAVNVWTIMSKVRLEAFMWGAGTALGELPPYFVARAHRLAGDEADEDLDADLAEEITGGGVANAGQRSFAARFRSNMIRLVTRVGFFGILACASIPNPLFDLAGITCGYSLVPFWTFFGATLIGKAVIKMHIQKLFVIVAFNESYVELFVDKSRNIPYIGQYLHEPLREFLAKQKQSLHRGSAGRNAVKASSWLSTIFEWVVISMLAYFAVSIINSMAQNNQKRLQKADGQQSSAAECGDQRSAALLSGRRVSANHLKAK